MVFEIRKNPKLGTLDLTYLLPIVWTKDKHYKGSN